MSFYVGSYQILADSLEPKTDSGPWALPGDQDQHMADTSNVEELFLDVTDMDVVPTRIQFGAATWTDDEGVNLDDTFTQMFYQSGNWYVRGFTGEDFFTPMFYQTAEWYLRGFTRTDFFTPMFYGDSQFYVRSWVSGTDLYNQFYVNTQESFYVRNWSPVSFWSEFYPADYS